MDQVDGRIWARHFILQREILLHSWILIFLLILLRCLALFQALNREMTSRLAVCIKEFAQNGSLAARLSALCTTGLCACILALFLQTINVVLRRFARRNYLFFLMQWSMMRRFFVAGFGM